MGIDPETDAYTFEQADPKLESKLDPVIVHKMAKEFPRVVSYL